SLWDPGSITYPITSPRYRHECSGNPGIPAASVRRARRSSAGPRAVGPRDDPAARPRDANTSPAGHPPGRTETPTGGGPLMSDWAVGRDRGRIRDGATFAGLCRRRGSRSRSRLRLGVRGRGPDGSQQSFGLAPIHGRDPALGEDTSQEEPGLVQVEAGLDTL